MKRATALMFFCCLGASGAGWWPSASNAQQAKSAGVYLDLKDGRQVLATGFRLSDNTLLATQPVGTGTGEIGYPLNTVDRVEFPVPPPLATAREELAQNRPGAALTQIEPIVAYYAPFRTVPGNWWLPSVLVKLDALADLRRDGEFDALLAELGRLTGEPAAEEAFRLRTAEGLARHDRLDKAEPLLDALIKTSTDEDTLARAWVGKGTVLSGRRDFDAALLAYLHVPVFYPEARRSMAAALLGSGRAFGRLDQRDKAREALGQLVSDYPSAPEATEAKNELQRLTASQPAS